MTLPFMPPDVPDGYPRTFERRLTLADGVEVLVRPVVPADAALLADEVAHADAETLYLRFFTPSIRLGPDRLRRLTDLDYRHRFAVAAFAEDGEGIGIARYEGDAASTEAEIAVTVKPGWRHRGVASRLLELLDEAGRDNGIEGFFAYYLEENDGAAALLAGSGFGRPVFEDGVVKVTKRLACPSERRAG